jgi:hypothetical protein
VQADSAPPSHRSRFVAGHPPSSYSIPIRFLVRSWGNIRPRSALKLALSLSLQGNPRLCARSFLGKTCLSRTSIAGMHHVPGPKPSGATAHGHFSSPYPRDAMLHLRSVSLGRPDLSKLWPVLAGMPRTRRGAVLLTAPSLHLRGFHSLGKVLRPACLFIPIECRQTSNMAGYFPAAGGNRRAGHFLSKYSGWRSCLEGLRLWHGNDAAGCHDRRAWNTTLILRLMQRFTRHTQCGLLAALALPQPRAQWLWLLFGGRISNRNARLLASTSRSGLPCRSSVQRVMRLALCVGAPVRDVPRQRSEFLYSGYVVLPVAFRSSFYFLRNFRRTVWALPIMFGV